MESCAKDGKYDAERERERTGEREARERARREETRCRIYEKSEMRERQRLAVGVFGAVGRVPVGG